jgi:glycerol-3-phosphate acyltransferase PlsX
MRVAVDAMGGDRAPEVPVLGAVEAATQLGVHVTLVGNRPALERFLDRGYPEDRIELRHCEEVVSMEEPPLKAVRRKKDSSIRVAFELAKEGAVDAVVSAGNSGAILAAAFLALGRMKGVERPAIAGIFPGIRGPVILIDVGANVDCRPAHLFQFGIMADAFATSCLDMQKPKIGLLSIGEEVSKGNEQVRLTHKLYGDSRLNFVGNVEGRDIFGGDVQIVVCDGFVGNVALKVSEGLAEAVSTLLKRAFMDSLPGRVGLYLGRRSLKKFAEQLNYEEYGGAPLLGVNGVGIVCHGGSSARAIRNAVGLAAQYVDNRVLDKMMLRLGET